MVDDERKYEYIKQTVHKLQKSTPKQLWKEGVWLGGQYDTSSMSWRWSDGNHIPVRRRPERKKVFHAWHGSQPNSNKQNCLFMGTMNTNFVYYKAIGKWFDGYCSEKKLVACEMRSTLGMLNNTFTLCIIYFPS